MPDTMPGEPQEAKPESLANAVRDALRAAWVPAGYTAPNTEVYPWLWLWDSCFHAIVWAQLGEADRAVEELETALSAQDPSGFVPHMSYRLEPERSVELWGRRGSSSITQPPMYGHAIAHLAARGIAVPDSVIAQAEEGLRFLLERRARDESGLVRVVHPWETGCDDSPRWDDCCPGGFDLAEWRRHKVALLAGIETGAHGEPVDNSMFSVAPVGFSALVAWNAQELAAVTGDDQLRRGAAELADALRATWNPDLSTWVDQGANAISGRVRTADALLPLLVESDPAVRDAVVAELLDEHGFGGRFGPRGVHRAEPVYQPDVYWRGPVWPQLAYLLWLAVAADDRHADAAEQIRVSTVAGARRSGLAEYWNGDTGAGGGAIPQSWTGLALVLDTAPTN